MSRGIWDKQPNRNFTVGGILDDICCCDSVLFGTRFALYGWSPTPRDARISTLHSLSLRAQDIGVLADDSEAKRLPSWLEAGNRPQWVQKFFPDDQSEVEGGDACVQQRHGFWATVVGVKRRIGDVANQSPST